MSLVLYTPAVTGNVSPGFAPAQRRVAAWASGDVSITCKTPSIVDGQVPDVIAGKGRPTLRRVNASDTGAMQRFVMGLSGAARRMRFHGAVNACTPGLLRQLTQADGSRHVAFVACVRGDDGEQIVGEARYFVAGTSFASAEFAIAVTDGLQGRGLADGLLSALLEAAGAAGVGKLYGDVLAGNARMAGFMQRHGFAIDWSADVEAGTARWQRAVPRPPDITPSRGDRHMLVSKARSNAHVRDQKVEHRSHTRWQAFAERSPVAVHEA